MPICALRPAVGLLVLLLAGSQASAQAPWDHPESRAAQHRLARGWNTWDSRSVLTHVRLPEGFALGLGFKQTYWLGDRSLRRALVGRRGEDAEIIRPGYHALDGSYTQLEIAWRGIHASVESGHDGEDLVLLMTPLASPGDPSSLVVEASMPWNRPGSLSRQENTLAADLVGRRIIVHVTATPVEDPYVDAGTPYLVVPFTHPIGISTGRSRSIEEIRGVLAGRRAALEREAAAHGDLAETYLAVLAGLAWNTIYEPRHDRVVSTVGRLWNEEYGGYCLFGWDNFFLAYMASLYSRDLAMADIVEHLRSATQEGFIPNDDRGNGAKSWDRSQPPVGALMVREVYRRYPERWLLDVALEPLLAWNRWWVEKRRNGSLLSYGSHLASNPHNEPAARTRTGAGYESGMDDSPMYDGVPYSPEKGVLELHDVGLNSLYLADCAAIEEMASIAGRPDVAREVSERAARVKEAMAGLWDPGAGLYLNRRTDTGQVSAVVSPTMLYPLLARLPDAARAKAMVDRYLLDPDQFGGEFVLPSISRRHPDFARQRYWKGAAWPPLNFLVYLGLRNYGADAARRALAGRSHAMFIGEWRRKGLVSENYSSITGTGDDPRLSSDPLHAWGGLMGLVEFIERGALAPPERPLPGEARR